MTTHTQDEQNAWKLENIDLLSWLFAQPAVDGEQNFLSDMRKTVRDYGMLTYKQTIATRKWMETREKREAQKREDDKISANAPKLEGGRRELRGEIMSTKWHDGDFGSQLKMTVRLEDGNRVWGTVPSNLWDGSIEEEEALKGRGVIFTATVKPREDHFGFFSRPSNGKFGRFE